MPRAMNKKRKLNLNGIALKPSQKSKVLGTCVLSSFSKETKQIAEKSNVLFDLIKNIFIGDEVSIKDYYSTLVTYFLLNVNQISYDDFAGAYESAKIGCEIKQSVSRALPYGALITSGLILKWRQEQQNQIVSKMLKIYQNNPECMNLVFHYLIPLGMNVKLGGHKLKKMTIDSPLLLYFVLSVDSKQESCGEDIILTSEDMLDLTEVYVKESEGFELNKELSVLLAKKLLVLGKETTLKFWDNILQSCDPRTDYKDMMVLHLLRSILENCSQNEILSEIDKLFTSTVVTILSKSNFKIESFSKSISSSLRNIAQNLSGRVKLSIIEIILLNSEKYIEKKPVVKICDTLASYMTFEEVSQATELYRQVIMGEKLKQNIPTSNDSTFTEFERIYCVRFFGKLISLNACKYQVSWRKTQFKFLFEIGFLNEFKKIIGAQLAGVSRKIFFVSLNQKFPKLIDLDNILKKLVSFAGKKMDMDENNFVIPFKKNYFNLWTRTLDVLKKLKESDNEDKLVFKVLLRYMMLFIFSEYSIAKNSLEELFKVIENKESEFAQIHWSEVTVDVFLHLLSGNANIHKNVIHSTFSHVSKNLTHEGLRLILSAISGKEEEDEKDDLSNSSDEGSISSDEEEEESNDESKSESENDENLGQMDKLKDALRQELFKIDTASTCGSVDLDDLDEAEGKQLNSTLAEIFKAQHVVFKSSAKNKVDSLEVHFRIRALNLLEIFIDNEPSLYSSMYILTNIISLLKTSIPNHSIAPFTGSLKNCLKNLTSLKKFTDCSCVTETSICSAFNNILAKDCSASVYQDMTEQIVESCLFLIRCSTFVSEISGEMDSCLKSTLEHFFKDTNSPVPFLLFNTIFSSLTIGKLVPLTSEIIKNAFSVSLKPHKRTQALQLLMTFYNNNRLFKDVGEFKDSLINLEKIIIKKSFKFISKIDEADINQKYGCMYLDLLALLKTKNKILTNEPGPHWTDLTEIINKLSTVPIFQKELKVSFVNFCKIFNHELASTLTESPSKSIKENKKRKMSPKTPTSLKKKKQKKNQSS